MAEDLDTVIEQALDTLMRETASDFQKTMATWQTHRPAVSTEASKYHRVVYVEDQIFAYLNDGTPVRRALLSKDWKSKTKVRTIGSGPGSGHVVMVSKKFAFKGIEARHFDEAIRDRIVTEILPNVVEKLADDTVQILVSLLP